MDAMRFAKPTDDSIPLTPVYEDDLAQLRGGLSAFETSWMATTGFKGKAGTITVFPNGSGGAAGALVGLGKRGAARNERFPMAAARARLPTGTYHLAGDLDKADVEAALLGWLFAGYAYGRYKSAPTVDAHLIAPDGVDVARIEAIAAGETLTRDLINTPASDMGPIDLTEAS
ncbi:MAG: leucyl aminopeptidase family protein, partial [Pseudomonadota bacterium]